MKCQFCGFQGSDVRKSKVASTGHLLRDFVTICQDCRNEQDYQRSSDRDPRE